MNVFTIDKQYINQDFELGTPTRLQGGNSYYSKLTYQQQPFLVQTPKCSTKSGIVKTDKKMYTDLVFRNDEITSETSPLDFVSWTFDFEKTLKSLLLEKSSLWFHNSMDMDDIEYFFNSSLKSYKHNFQTMRTYIGANTIGNQASSQPKLISKQKTTPSILIYDEDENEKEIQDIKDDTYIYAILHIKGIRFTNTSFHVDIELKQIMILHNDIQSKDILATTVTKPLIKRDVATIPPPTTQTHIETKADVDLEIEQDTTTNVIYKNVEETSLEKNKETNNEERETTIDLDTLGIYEEDKNEDTMQNTSEDTPETKDNEEPEEVLNVSFQVEDTIKEEKPEQHNKHSLEFVETDNQDTLDLDIEELPYPDYSTKQHLLEEVDLNIENVDTEPVQLKKPNQVYFDLYSQARQRAKDAKKLAIIAYLEAKNIKNTYLIDEVDSSDDDFDDLSISSMEDMNEDENDTLE